MMPGASPKVESSVPAVPNDAYLIFALNPTGTFRLVKDTRDKAEAVEIANQTDIGIDTFVVHAAHFRKRTPT